MDQFYQVLRKVQKKERNNGTLTRVEETFYNDIHEYMDELKQQAINDPFSKAPAMLKEAQIIATEICQRRETKITNSAVLNIHRSYHLFTGKPQFDLVDTTPLNLTPEEEKFYFSLIDTLKNHRNNISLEKLSEEDKKIIKPLEIQSNTLTSPQNESPQKINGTPKVETSQQNESRQVSGVPNVENNSKVESTPKIDVSQNSKQNDEVLDRLDDISKAKPITDQKREPIEKQIAKSQHAQVKQPPKTNVEENPNAFDEKDEFYDLESKKIAKDVELVTMLVYDEIGAIVGVDERIYGPFRPQDLVTLPLINAKIFIKNRKGRQVKI